MDKQNIHELSILQMRQLKQRAPDQKISGVLWVHHANGHEGEYPAAFGQMGFTIDTSKG
jgi:hypothetical protein